LYHKNTTHTTLRREKFDKKRPPLGGFWGISIYSTVKDPDLPGNLRQNKQLAENISLND
jgi:hypothetical protein